jgi:hypothetical protein
VFRERRKSRPALSAAFRRRTCQDSCGCLIPAPEADPTLVAGDCDTGKAGVCAEGVEQCSAGTIECGPAVEASSESCDGLDNDCDGTIDDGVCWQIRTQAARPSRRPCRADRWKTARKQRTSRAACACAIGKRDTRAEGLVMILIARWPRVLADAGASSGSPCR